MNIHKCRAKELIERCGAAVLAGRAGAIVSGRRDTAQAKVEAMRIAESPVALGSAMMKALRA